MFATWLNAGDGTTADKLVPTVAVFLTSIAQITCGYRHTCARNATGVYCFGQDNNGQLGDGFTGNRAVAAPVTISISGAPTVAYVSAGGLWELGDASHTCALFVNGSVTCWGDK